MLRSWGAPGELAAFLDLKQIHIYETKRSFDSPERTKANLEDFKIHLNDARSVECKKDDKKSGLEYEYVKAATRRSDDLCGYAQGVRNSLRSGTHRPQSRKKIDEHQWLDMMDTFAGGVCRVHEEKLSNFPDQYLTCSTLPRELSRDVTVALVDNGVDFMHSAISKNLMPARSFDSDFSFNDRFGSPAPFHRLTTGHGAFMAYVIQRVCPGVKTFVCKIYVLHKGKEGDAVTFTTKSAADAVEDVANRWFDIISMSWSAQENESTDVALNNTAHLNLLKESLEKASNDRQGVQGKKIGKETLLFCSAPGTGESSLRDTHYPFNCDGILKMVKIGAAQLKRKTYPWTSNQIDYILPGENVGMKPPDRVRPNEDNVLRTGTSVATALAAGLAAMIIHRVRLGAVYNFHKNNRTGVNERSARAIKTFKAMKAAFENISKSD